VDVVRRTIPFSAQGYRIKALFKETGLLVPQRRRADRRRQRGQGDDGRERGVNSLVTIDVQRQYAPLPKDTQAILRQKTLLGEAYVMLSTGTACSRARSRPSAAAARISTTRSATSTRRSRS
jgi:phospholipid/cholesterol/gamma-HCH transport system substrate-binding protein